MGVEGIGASVVRKEDRRFITGKGRYVDDIKLQGMTFAHFVRSPHAHAKVKGIDSSAAGSTSYSTTTASAASRAWFLVSAMTTATACPTKRTVSGAIAGHAPIFICLLYTSPSPRD